ncbi:hypothetical protein DYB38_013737 [Aphanomyces astaci]|uniref:Ricin B lectin domain-containing protein n=1 Tax=Aphanomyces astaci TaxID=112090 RepID=A0A397E314_APHAT|nr:hypothetical protein DYB38_013737 [Aphanomyces astaci]
MPAPTTPLVTSTIANGAYVLTGNAATRIIGFPKTAGSSIQSTGQQWTVHPTTQKSVRLAGTNLCLDGYEGFNGGTVHLWPCDAANPNQKWVYDVVHQQFRHGTFAGFCLDFNAKLGVTHLWTCLDATSPDMGNQVFQVKSVVQLRAKGKVLSGLLRKVTFLPSGSNVNQYWFVDPVRRSVQLQGTSLCLDGFEATNGGTVHLWECSDTNPNQKWKLDDRTKQLRHGTFEGFCLDFADDGVRPHLWTCLPRRHKDIKNQQFALIRQDGASQVTEFDGE